MKKKKLNKYYRNNEKVYGEFLHEYLSRTRKIRRGIVDAGQDTDSPDFGRRDSAEVTEKK